MLVDEGALAGRGRRLERNRGTSTSCPIPPTINALLAARLDRLDADERAVLPVRGGGRQGVLVGRGRGARRAGARDDVAPHLHALVRKG